MRGHVRLVCLLLACVAGLPEAARGQATLIGVARDASGAVLPGVSVEAASPVLIERVRTTTTDGAGQYRIVDLRGGLYTVTFTLAGFSTVRREGIELLGESIVTVNAVLPIGTVTEAVTVTGEQPAVDTRSVTREEVITRDVIDTLPTGRYYHNLGQLLPGVVSDKQTDPGGSLGDTLASLTIHGSRASDQRVLQNGVSTMTLQLDGNVGIAVPNPGMASEVTIDTSGLSAELTTGGVRINYIPRDGGNNFSSSTYFAFANNSMQADNLTSDLQARGLSTPDSIKTVYDINPSGGGPIKRDLMWFYATARVNRADQNAGGSFANKNAYDPNAWTYVPDPNRPGYNRSLWTDGQIRLTVQPTPKNKLSFTWDQQTRCSCPGYNDPDVVGAHISAITSPEASANFRAPQQRLLYAEWSSPMTNRLLTEVVGLFRTERWGFMAPNASVAPDFITSAEQSALESGALVPVFDASTGLFYRAEGSLYNNNWDQNFYVRATASYVTGGHQIKAGITDMWGYIDSTVYNYSPLTYILNIVPGLPLAMIDENIYPLHQRSDQNYDLGMFLQDRWTLNRWTLNLGVRFDALKTGSPAQLVVGSTPLTPNRPDIALPPEDFGTLKDITPRLGATYDLLGDGKTAIKVSLNKYLQGQTVGSPGQVAGSGGPNPVNRLVNSTSRLWFDANQDFVPQCDLTSPAPNGECGPMLNPNFGSPDPNATQFSPSISDGWGKRGYNWEFALGVQHEIMPGTSVDVSYFRRIYGNFVVMDNLALGPNDFTTYSITAPVAPGLSTSGQTITGLVDPNMIVPSKYLNTAAGDYGQQHEHWNGVDVSINARFSRNSFFFGGLSTGKTMVDNCQIAQKVPESMFVQGFFSTILIPYQFCHVESPFRTQVKLNGSYTIPKVGVLLAVTFQSLPGSAVRADYTVVERAPGVPLTNGPTTVELVPGQFVAPGGFLENFVAASDYGDRLNQVDLRFSKLFRAGGRARAAINFDVFNIFNSSAVTRENPQFGAFRQPTEIQLARYLKIGALFEF
jgi:hypothetical protein